MVYSWANEGAVDQDRGREKESKGSWSLCGTRGEESAILAFPLGAEGRETSHTRNAGWTTRFTISQKTTLCLQSPQP